MDFAIINHVTYLTISIVLTIWVAHTLHHNGRVFLIEAFENEELADSVNHLLVVGFYLINLGVVALGVSIWGHATTWQAVIENVSFKVGLVLLVLGAMHFFNVSAFWKYRKSWYPRRAQAGNPPPIPT